MDTFDNAFRMWRPCLVSCRLSAAQKLDASRKPFLHHLKVRILTTTIASSLTWKAHSLGILIRLMGLWICKPHFNYMAANMAAIPQSTTLVSSSAMMDFKWIKWWCLFLVIFASLIHPLALTEISFHQYFSPLSQKLAQWAFHNFWFFLGPKKKFISRHHPPSTHIHDGLGRKYSFKNV